MNWAKWSLSNYNINARPTKYPKRTPSPLELPPMEPDALSFFETCEDEKYIELLKNRE